MVWWALFQSWCTLGWGYYLVADIFAKHNSERIKHHPQESVGSPGKESTLTNFIALAWRKSTLRWVCLTPQPHFFQTFSLLLASSKSASAWNKLQWATKKKTKGRIRNPWNPDCFGILIIKNGLWNNPHTKQPGFFSLLTCSCLSLQRDRVEAQPAEHQLRRCFPYHHVAAGHHCRPGKWNFNRCFWGGSPVDQGH